MAHDAREPGAVGHADRLERLGERADLVHLHQDRVGHPFRDAAGQDLGVGDEDVVAHQLDLPSQPVGEELPALPVVLAAAVLDGDDGVLGHQALVPVHEPLGVVGLPLPLEDVLARPGVEDLGEGAVERQADLLARLEAGGRVETVTWFVEN